MLLLFSSSAFSPVLLSLSSRVFFSLPAASPTHRIIRDVSTLTRRKVSVIRERGALRCYDDMDHWCHTDVTRRLYPEVTTYRWHRCKNRSETTFEPPQHRKENEGGETARRNARDQLRTAFNVIIDYVISILRLVIGRTRVCTRA